MLHLQYLGRQPILDAENSVIAYDLFYRDEHLASNFENPRFATASVLVSVLNKFGVTNILGGKRAYIKLDDKFLMHDLIFSIPKEYFSFSIICHNHANERNIERLEQLKERGYSIGINDINIDHEAIDLLTPLLDLVEYIKIDTMFTDIKLLKEFVSTCKAKNVKLFATKIETNAVFEQYKELGCDYFQGYYFAKPNIIENAVVDPKKMAVFKIYQRLLDESSIDEIVEIFEENHAITLQLLQYINSPMFSFKSTISSIHQVITLVGRKPLSQWLLLSVYSKSISGDNEGATALMLQVKTRTELMTALIEHVEPSLVSQAYFVGVLSLIDTLFFMPLSDILKQLHIDKIIEDALLFKHGILGETFQMVLDIENFNIEKIDSYCQVHKIDSEKFEKIIAEHIYKVNELDKALKGS